MLILGIETTCDETAAAVVENGRIVHSSVVSSQVDLHAKYGGVVPEIASRAHLEQINPMVAEALTRAHVHDPARQLTAVAVANAPGLIGCLLVGVAAAKAFSFAWKKPLVAVNHVQAHLYSVLLEEREEPDGSGNKKSKMDNALAPRFPALGLVISGGHTSMYLVESFHQLRRIGATHDDAVGEAFDKVAAILQLGYPGGPLIDRLAHEGLSGGGPGDEHAIKFPLSLMEKDSLDFSFSGIKTSVLYHVNGKKGRERDASALSAQQKADVAASFQRTAADMIVEKLRRGAAHIGAQSILMGGGVSANSAIRWRVMDLGRELRLPVFIPPMAYCTDNAAMIAGLAYPLLQAGVVADLDLEAIATT